MDDNVLPTNVTSMVFHPLAESDAYDQDPDRDGVASIDELVKGEAYPIYFRGDELLEVSLNSADFAFGVLPTHNTFGHINFPNTVATTPCIHDFNAPTDGRRSLHILIDGCIPT